MRSDGNNFNYFTENQLTKRQLGFLLTLVIHYQSDYWYGHGRTGRAGDDGLVLAVVSLTCVKALHGVNQDEPRWRMCVRYVNDNFGMAVGRIFVERHFNDRAKANVSQARQNLSLFQKVRKSSRYMCI